MITSYLKPTNTIFEITSPAQETVLPNSSPRVVLIAIADTQKKLDFILDETRDLIRTLDFEIAAECTQLRNFPDKRYAIGTGKLDELKTLIEDQEINQVVFGNALSPGQNRNLERYLELSIWDRTKVILEIFSRHANTFESQMQVELAHSKYMLPRLKGMWQHLDKERGGSIISRGMGEKQINIDRNILKKKITQLEQRLKKSEKNREVQSKNRKNIFKVCLAGYTNAGKSTVFNLLTQAGTLIQDKLFATLDSTTRKLDFGKGREIIISDTVGFIDDLPMDLVATFKSTLSVITEADLILNVIDISASDPELCINTTNEIIAEITTGGVPVINVFNKMDLPESKDRLTEYRANYENTLFISALEKESIDILRDAILNCYDEKSRPEEFILDYSDSGMVDYIYKNLSVEKIAYEEDGIHMTARGSSDDFEKLIKRVPGIIGLDTGKFEESPDIAGELLS